MGEVQEAIFQMEHNKASGPDGFSVKFYQSCWEIIKSDLMALLYEFHNGDLPLYSLNFGMIIQNVGRRQQYSNRCLFVC
jgi:hypothetical protein